jgi:hypothetical protein
MSGVAATVPAMENNFDFYVGTWDVANRRLSKPLVGSDDWEEFPAVSIAHRFFDGAGNFDEIDFPTKGFSGATVRTYDKATDEWSLYWINSGKPSTLREPPVVGRFDGDEGLFYADDTYEGRPIKVRYRWSDISATSARWEQAFSTDGGVTWETNWTMDSTRRA